MRNDAELPTYPLIGLLVRHGGTLAVLAGLLLAAAGFYGTYVSGQILFAVAGVVVGLAVWLILASYVEVLKIVSDMLMPR